jgi:hypothetical protein
LVRQSGIICYGETEWYHLLLWDRVVSFVMVRQSGIICYGETEWYHLSLWDRVVSFAMVRQSGIICYGETEWYHLLLWDRVVSFVIVRQSGIICFSFYCYFEKEYTSERHLYNTYIYCFHPCMVTLSLKSKLITSM